MRRAAGRAGKSKTAQAALLAVAVQLVLVEGQDANLRLWRDRLRALLCDIPAPDAAMQPVVEAVHAYLSAMDRDAVSVALWRLKVQLGRYYQRAAVVRLETWGQAG